MTFVGYGISVLIVLALAWASGEHVKQKLGLVLLMTWTISNCAVFALGFHDAPGPISVANGLLAFITMLLGYKNRSVSALLVVALYVIGEGLSFSAIARNLTDTYTFWLLRNLIFTAQMIVVGGSSGVAALARIGARDHRPDHSRALA